MLIVMKSGSSRDELERVKHVAEALGFRAHVFPLEDCAAVAVSGSADPPNPALFEFLPGVLQVAPVSRPLKRVCRPAVGQAPPVRVGEKVIGGGELTLIAGPCAVESEEQLLPLARTLGQAGVDLLRGGAYKPRTSPYDFQGLGEEGLRILARAREETGLPVVTEAVDAESLVRVEKFADMVQIGARNMQNFALLRRAGRCRLPVLLKRGFSASLEDLLMAAEYLLSEGNPNVVLCERGVRTFSDHSRYTLDLAIVPRLKRLSHLPILVDPSHASGIRESVAPLARAAVAAGADGVMVEVHPDPVRALCDGPQSLRPAEFVELAAELRALARHVARPREAVS